MKVKEKLPTMALGGLVGTIAYTLLTSGVFAQKADIAVAKEALRAEMASNYITKEEVRQDLIEIKIILKEMDANIEDLKVQGAKQG